MKKATVLFLLVLILASALRLYHLGKTPSSLEWDEVAIGYDAFSVLKTGRDQFGHFLPVTFRSLDDYKPPIYEYLAVPSIAVFGLNSFSVRLPSALAGIGMVFLLYFFAGHIFNFIPSIVKHRTKAALLSTFFLAVSPWHLQFSRAAFEVNVSAFLTLLAVFLYLLGLKNKKLFVISALFFGIDLFSYHSTRVVAPLLLFTLFILFNRQLPDRKTVLFFLLVFAAFFLAVLPILSSKDAQIRFAATNIFKPAARYLNEKDLEKIFLEKRVTDEKIGFPLAGKIFHNRRLIFFDYDTLKKAAANYLSNFRFQYLFIDGDAPLHHAPGFGLFHIILFPLITAGILFLLFKNINAYSLFLFAWLLIAVLPDAVTREAPHAVRTLLILPTYQLLAAAGAVFFIDVLFRQSAWLKFLIFIFFTFLFVANNSYYLHQYYVHTDYDVAEDWKYGRQQAVAFTERAKKNYDQVYVSLSVDMPFIFWLFYSGYPPDQYLKEGGTVSGGFADQRNKFDRYQFRNFDYHNLSGKGKLLLVGTSVDFPPGAKIIKTIYNPNGTKSLLIAEN